MSMTSELFDGVCGLLNELDYIGAYSAAVFRRTEKQDKWARLFVACAACAPFIAKLTSAAPPNLASWMTAVLPLAAIGLPIWSPGKRMELAAKIELRTAVIGAALMPHWHALRAVLQQGRELNDADLEKANAALAQANNDRAAVKVDLLQLPDIPALRAKASASVRDYCKKSGPIPSRLSEPGTILHAAPASSPVPAAEPTSIPRV